MGYLGSIAMIPKKPINPDGSPRESVDHPEHYGGADDPYETIKIIEALGWGYEFCLGNALKYIMRAGKKPGVRAATDLEKAAWYLQRARNLLEEP